MDYVEFTIRVPKNPRIRFGLATVFVLALIVAIGLGAFRFGSESGYNAGFSVGYQSGWSESMSEKLVKEKYRVSDLLPTPNGTQTVTDEIFVNLDDLVDEIVASVEPSSWTRNRGPAEVSVYPQSLSLIVNQTRQGHDAMTQFFRQKRSEN